MEAALLTSETIRKIKTQDVTVRKLRGSVVVAVTAETTRRKWVEKCGYMMAPNRRHLWPTMIGRDALIAAWSPSWHDAWHNMDAGSLSPMAAWTAITDAGLPDLGLDPSGVVPLTDTWVWTPKERKRYFVVRLDTEDDDVCRAVYYAYNDGVAYGPRYALDYRNDLSLSGADIAKVEDENILVDPNLTTAWSSTLLVGVCASEDIIELATGP